MTDANPQAFAAACSRVLGDGKSAQGIGTLGEKTLHAIIKEYFFPQAPDREVKIGRFVADAVGEDGIYEIQTRAFDRLRPKLQAFLPAARVTVVYPVAAQKYLCWLDADTGEASPLRKSPRRGSIFDIFPELYKIRMFLGDPNLSLCIMLLSVEEYRFFGQPGKAPQNRGDWSFGGKKHCSVRFDRVPKELLGQVWVENMEQYRQFLPENLPRPFTSLDFSKAAHCTRRVAQTALLLLTETGTVERCGKQANRILYTAAP